MATWLVVGLGNPGPTYASHRHNAGYLVVEELARRAHVTFAAPRGMRAEVAETRLTTTGMGGIGAQAERLILMKSRTFMNESGAAVAKVASYYQVPADHVVAIHDELDIDFGHLRCKFGGGDNGHNGLKSMRSTLGTGDFFRVRFGIGRPPGQQDPAAFVLSPFPATVRAELDLEVGRAADAVETLIMLGLDTAQNRFNA